MRTIAEYRDRYAGRRFVIVGKGPTQFEYKRLAEFADPIIFINDAVQFECHAMRAPETFMFAHDQCQTVWFKPGLRSTVVLPLVDSISSGGKPMLSVATAGERLADVNYVTYKWHNEWRNNPTDRTYLRDKDNIAKNGHLYLRTGTIHTAIHFAWLCGAARLTFIGCDGKEPAGASYDARIAVRSGGKPLHVFQRIREHQDWLCEALRLPVEYLGGPSAPAPIPRLAHFVWLGLDVPSWVKSNVESFRRHNPLWHVRLWRRPPPDMPDDLLRIMADATQVCTQKDVMAYWLLWKYGGVFLDADMVTVQDFEPLRRHRAFACREATQRVNCAVVGSAAHGAAISRIVDQVRHVAGGKSTDRTRFGPTMLTDMWGRRGEGDRDLVVLPKHYFFPFFNQKTAHAWWKGNRAERQQMLDKVLRDAPDSTPPFAIHLWGVDGSSQRKAMAHADALIYRMVGAAQGNGHLCGVEVGVLRGNLSRRLLTYLPDLLLYMVDSWPGGNDGKSTVGGHLGGRKDRATALEVTEFAADRRVVLQGDSRTMALEVPDGALDFAFLDAAHDYDNIAADIKAWAPKVRPGGLVCGHDLDNPIAIHDGVDFWGVRQAVEEYTARLGQGCKLEVGAGYTWFVQKPK